MIIRRRHTANFTTIGNVLFEDERLALDEVGLMSWLLSRPNDWQVRRPALMRRFKIGRDGMRRVMRSLLRFGWVRAQVTRLSDGRVHVLYEVRDEPGPELSEDEARAALSLVSSGAGPGELPDDDGDGDGSEETGEGAEPPSDADPGGGSPPTGQPEAGSRLRLSPPGHIEESLKTDSIKTESPNRVGAFARVFGLWPAYHMLSKVTAEVSLAGLTDKDFSDCEAGIPPYLAECKTASRKVCDLTTFIRERRWERFTVKVSSSKPALIKVHSAQWYRWREYRVASGQSVKFMEHYAGNNPQGSWTEPTEWPPPMPAKQQETVLPDSEMREFK